MASVILKRSRPSALKSAVVVGIRMGMSSRAYASVAVGSDIVSAAPHFFCSIYFRARKWSFLGSL